MANKRRYYLVVRDVNTGRNMIVDIKKDHTFGKDLKVEDQDTRLESIDLALDGMSNKIELLGKLKSRGIIPGNLNNNDLAVGIYYTSKGRLFQKEIMWDNYATSKYLKKAAELSLATDGDSPANSLERQFLFNQEIVSRFVSYLSRKRNEAACDNFLIRSHKPVSDRIYEAIKECRFDFDKVDNYLSDHNSYWIYYSYPAIRNILDYVGFSELVRVGTFSKDQTLSKLKDEKKANSDADLIERIGNKVPLDQISISDYMYELEQAEQVETLEEEKKEEEKKPPTRRDKFNFVMSIMDKMPSEPFTVKNRNMYFDPMCVGEKEIDVFDLRVLSKMSSNFKHRANNLARCNRNMNYPHFIEDEEKEERMEHFVRMENYLDAKEENLETAYTWCCLYKKYADRAKARDEEIGKGPVK